MTLYSLLSAYLPDRIRDPFWHLYFGLSPYAGLRYPIRRATGPVGPKGRSATVLLAGRPGWFSRYFSSLPFSGPPTVEDIDAVPIWALGDRLRGLRDSADLTIALLGPGLAPRHLGPAFLRVPTWVGMRRPVPAELAGIDRSSRSLDDDLRRVRHHGYQACFSREPGEMDDFYQRYYLPTARCSHGEDALVRSQRGMRRCYAAGGMIWVVKGGQRVAGMLVDVRGDVMVAVAIGLRDGDMRLRREAAFAATYQFTLLQAGALGCRSVDFGVVRSFLCDGLLRYKSKWGNVLYDRGLGCDELAIAWPRWSPGLSDLLRGLSCVFRDDGRLSAVSSLDTAGPASSEAAVSRRRALWVAGLHRLYLVSGHGWQAGVESPPGTILLRPEQAATARGLLDTCRLSLSVFSDRGGRL